MTAKLTEAIPPQSFELVRARICVILATELANQQTITPSFTKPDVWEERFYPFNEETEMPAINVTYADGAYENENIKKSDGAYLFNIDVYTVSASTEDMKGDKASMLLMSKIAGMVRAILMNPAYNLLGYTPPTFVINRRVRRFFIGDKSTVEDALSRVVGRIQFEVKAVETTELATGSAFQLGVTTVKLIDTEYGFKYEYQD